MNARARILQRLTSPTGISFGHVDFSSRPAAPDVAAYYAAHRRAEDGNARLARFRDAIVAAHAEVIDTDTDQWPTRLAEIATAKGLRRLLAGADCPDAARFAAAAPPDLELVSYDRPIDAWRNELFTGIDAGLTRARSAIAATGSLVLWPGPGEPRLLSLVPPVHIVLLDSTAIHADLHAAMTAEGWAGALPTNALLVSGPSKTADIQQTLAYGAHGPRELVVLLRQPVGSPS